MTRLFTSFCAFVIATGAFAQAGYRPAPENLLSRSQFADCRFGIFLHWGLYAMLAQGEWAMTNHNLNYREYEKLAGGFYPSKFDADAWAEAFRQAGARYVCFTTRHHDGFSMFGTGRPAEKEDADAYFDFMKAQLTELLTQYGNVGAIWFDGIWDQDENPGFDWRLGELYGLIHKLQPGCLIINNHHLAPFEGEDAQAFERDLPGENTAGYSGQEISRLPLETCQTMNGMWGYKITDQNYKSAQTLVRYLAGAAGRGANLLLNIGPQPDGALPAAALERLDSMGRWLRANGETIYGTQAGPVSPRSWGVTTRRGDKIYVHILDWPDEELFVPVRDERIRRAVRFADKRAVAFSQDKAGVTLRLGEKPAGADCIVELTVGQ